MLYVTETTVDKWENGEINPDMRQLPAIASLFGVSIEDITSKSNLPTNSKLKERKLNTWLWNSRSLLIVISILVLIGIGVSISNFIWASYLSNTFDPFLQSETIQAIPTWDKRVSRSKGSEIHIFTDYSRSGYLYTFSIPARFNFGGYISISTNPNLSDFIELQIRFNRDKKDFVLTLGTSEAINYTDERGIEVFETNSTRTGIAIDINGHPIPGQIDENEVFYKQWLYLYERNVNLIEKLLNNIKTMFGEDALS